MITSIKSAIIIKNIFKEFLHKKAELKILKINKSLQNKVGISLENYYNYYNLFQIYYYKIKM